MHQERIYLVTVCMREIHPALCFRIPPYAQVWEAQEEMAFPVSPVRTERMEAKEVIVEEPRGPGAPAPVIPLDFLAVLGPVEPPEVWMANLVDAVDGAAIEEILVLEMRVAAAVMAVQGSPVTKVVKVCPPHPEMASGS